MRSASCTGAGAGFRHLSISPQSRGEREREREGSNHPSPASEGHYSRVSLERDRPTRRPLRQKLTRKGRGGASRALEGHRTAKPAAIIQGAHISHQAWTAARAALLCSFRFWSTFAVQPFWRRGQSSGCAVNSRKHAAIASPGSKNPDTFSTLEGRAPGA